MLTCDSYLSPVTLEDAFDAMASATDEFRLVAGATDILPWAREGRAGDVHIPTLIDIAGIPELRERGFREGRVRLGAATPFQRFLDDPMLREAMPSLDCCAIWFADDQIRESATIGGNIVNASPAGDGIPPLLALDADVELASRRNGAIARRRMPLAEFLTGPGRTELQPDEILVAIEADALPDHGGAFEKVGHRRSLVISVACVAAVVQLDASRTRFEDVRIGIGGVGPVAIRYPEAENILRGKPIAAECIEEAAQTAGTLVQSRSRQAYRRGVLEGFVVRALLEAAKDAGGDPHGLVPNLEEGYA